MRLPRLTLAFALALPAAAGCQTSEGTLVVLASGGAANGASGSGGTGGAAPAKPYVPAENSRFFTRLDGPVDLNEEADLFYLDAQLQERSDLERLHQQGRHYLCYLSAGTLESFRPDADSFPSSAVGNQLSGFPNERWLDVRNAQVRELMAARVAALGELGCDGVTPSSLATFQADSGFELDLQDALDYARWLAERVHAAGMSVGLSGPAALTAELWPSFDFGLAIGCVNGSGCSEYAPLVRAHRPVLHIELGDAQAAPELCKAAQRLGFQALISDSDFRGNCVYCQDIL